MQIMFLIELGLVNGFMKANLKAAFLLLFVLASLIPSKSNGQSTASGSVIVVPDDFPSIQLAINATNEGDTIQVRPGTYVERLIIQKRLSVIGSAASSTIIENTGSGNTVEISEGSGNVVFAGFTVKGNGAWSGIYVLRSLNNTIKDNVIVNHEYGIHIYDSGNITLKNNNMSNNKYNLRVWGLFLSQFLHDIDSSNLVDGKPIYYWINQRDKTLPFEAGCVALVNSSNIVVKDLNLSHNLAGVLLAYTNNSTIANVTAFSNWAGLYFVSSHYNNIVGNNLFNNSWAGILTISSHGNLFLGNTIRSAESGIRFSHSFNLLRYYSENNTIGGNVIENNYDGVYLDESHHNKVTDNEVINNTNYGIVVDGSSNNVFYHNDLTNNRKAQVNIFNSTLQSLDNRWYAEYPIGGNFWNSFAGADVLNGPLQDQPGSDGIIDKPYKIDENNIDLYPLLVPHSGNEAPIAQFSYSPQNPKKGDTVVFVNEASDHDGKIILGFWRFGDSFFFANGNISVKFDETQNYTVSLTVFDDEGSVGTVTKVLVVQEHLSVLYLYVPMRVSVGTSINLSAALWDPEKGVPLTDMLVRFHMDDGQTEVEIGFSTTNASGVAAVSYTPLKAGNFRIRAVFDGSQLYAGTSTVENLTVIGNQLPLLEGVIVVFVLVALTLGFLRWRVLQKRKNK